MVTGLKFALILVLLAFSAPLPAAAQTLPTISLTLDKDYYARFDRFSAQGTIVNTSREYAQNVTIALSVLPALGPGEPLYSMSSMSVARIQPVLRKEWNRTLSVGLTKVDIVRELTPLELTEGVYPVELSIAFPNRQTLTDRSFLVVIDPRVKRLPVGVMWSLHPGEHRRPDGRFSDDDLARLLKSEPENPGPLEQHLSLIEANPDLSINLAIGATLTEQVSDMANGYDWFDGKEIRHVGRDSSAAQDAGRWLDRLFALAETEPRVELMSSPYGEAPLPLFARLGWADDVRRQIDLADAGIPRSKKKRGGGFYIPGLTLDEHTAKQLIEAEFEFTLVLPESTTESTLSPQAPLHFAHNKQRLVVFSADTEIADWSMMATPTKASVELTAMLAQRLLAAGEHDMVMITQSADAAPRVELARKVYETLTDLPWIKTVTLSSVPKSASRPARLRTLRRKLTIDTEHRDAVARGRSPWIDFASAVSPNNEVSQRLARQLFRAQSIDFLIESPVKPSVDGKSYVDHVDRVIKSEFSKVKLAPPRAITFSTRRGKIPVAVFNGAGYPIKASLDIQSKDFSFPDDMNKKIVLKPKENLISYDVIAGLTGLNVLDVKISVGDSLIASRGIEVTVSNMLRYLVVSISALLIVGFGAMLWLKGRKK